MSLRLERSGMRQSRYIEKMRACLVTLFLAMTESNK